MTDSYHGMSIGATSAGGHPVHRDRLDGVLIPWEKLPRLSQATDSWDWERVDRMLGEAAAVILEPIGGTTSGAFVPENGMIEFIAERARQQGCLVIADEVVTGFGRTGKDFVTSPDLADVLISGKWLGGGYVGLCAIVLSDDLASEAYAQDLPLRFTFANLSLACSIATTLQGVISERGLVRQGMEAAVELKAKIETELYRAGVEAEVRGSGMLLAAEISTDDSAVRLKTMRARAHERGVIAMFGTRSGLDGSGKVHVMCTPPLDVTPEEVEILATTVKDIISG